MGGSGGKMIRFVGRDVLLDDGTADGHIVIRKGELYVSTALNFNPWAPGYAGEDGSIDCDFQGKMNEQARLLGWESPQTIFHLFRQCAKTAEEQPGVPTSAWHGEAAAGRGLYMGRYTFDEETPVEERDFDKLPQEVQESLLLWWLNHEGKQDTPQNRSVKVSELRQERVRYWPYKFVDYDEKLYAELVKQGCAYKDGRVETSPDKLGRLARYAR